MRILSPTPALLTGSAKAFGIYTLYSFIYVKSDNWGTLNWGYLSPASDNPAVLADISGTVIESNAVEFEGAGFFLRPSGNHGLSGLAWGNLMTCQGLAAGIGADCWGNPQAAVRYDSPTWGGFRFETSYGTNTLTPVGATQDNHFWDIAGFYTADWNSIKLSLAAAYTATESSAYADNDELFQVGGSILHKTSGLGIYALGQWEHPDGSGAAGIGPGGFSFDNPCTFPVGSCFHLLGGGDPVESFGAPDTNVWYVKPFWRKTWGSMNGVGLGALGATTLYGEYGQYNDQFVAGRNLCGDGFGSGTNVGTFCNGFFPGVGEGVFVTGSEVQRWGLGVVQEIDSAAMHVFARWQHQEADLTLVGIDAPGSTFSSFGDCTGGCRIHQSFDDWDLFQVGGIIFF